MYVVMDGFDLGIGILFPLIRDRDERDVMVNPVAPVWDGNETWLVLGGAGLMAAFPLAYSVILSALHLPLVFMLLGLIFRGVAFEFRFKADEHHRPLWDRAFVFGSVCATFFQGVTLGAYIEGIPVVDRAYQGGAWDWISPFSIFTGLGPVAPPHVRHRAATDAGAAGRHRRAQYLDAAGTAADCTALVQPAQHVLVLPSARSGGGRRFRPDPARARHARRRALHAVAVPGVPGLQRPGHQHLAGNHPA
ncbi:hypothetical protein G6F22_016477 [Rhizopus arrhizus]|nr:hypothetical protein G6F22_016477 [Rhizopus arrhizus]